jgi:hypothetical protein
MDSEVTLTPLEPGWSPHSGSNYQQAQQQRQRQSPATHTKQEVVELGVEGPYNLWGEKFMLRANESKVRAPAIHVLWHNPGEVEGYGIATSEL